MRKAFLSAPTGVASLIVLAILLLIGIVAPEFLNGRATELNLLIAQQNPTAQHWFGTDSLGRDIFARVLVASRLSIEEALISAGGGAVIGIGLGAGAAVLPRRIRSVVLRAIDAAIAFPGLLLAIFVVAIIGQGVVAAVLGTGIAISFTFARVTSALTMSIVGREYIAAARISGIGRTRLMLRHVIPNIAETLAITTTVAISYGIVTVSTLSFLGLGVQSPSFDWGTMLTDGIQVFYSTPVAALAPAVAVAITALAFGLLGEALARAMNPVLWAGRGDDDVPAEVKRGEDAETPKAADTPVVLPPLVGIHPNGSAAVVAADTNEELRVALDATLVVDHLSVCFPRGRGQFAVVDDVSFQVARGDRLGIVGESGSGKTTTALAIAGLVAYPGAVTGSIRLNGQMITEETGARRDIEDLLGAEMAVVYQDPLSSLNPALRIGTQLTEGIRIHRGVSRKKATSVALDRLREVNIPSGTKQLSRRPNEFSGGMRQRVMIAMGLMTEPSLLICDEPTTSLDVIVQAQIMDLLARVNRDHGTAIIFISHNLALVSQNTDRVLVMYAGRIVEDLSTTQLLEGGFHPYTRQLLATVPDASRPKEEQLIPIRGQAPDPASPPSGCPYHPRCPLASDRCRVERPPLRAHQAGRRVACWAVEEEVAGK